MSVAAIASVVPVSAPSSLASTASTASVDNGSSFSNALAGAIGQVQTTQSTADQLNVAVVTGDSNDISAATIASTRAQVEMQLVSAIRNQAVAGFNDIMNMSA
ncbi:MAG TPA: flagellar hook-basal body complex protein FliE [Galbitalea sp.]|jgi:flagellar hook-basal body complex protein FliE